VDPLLSRESIPSEYVLLPRLREGDNLFLDEEITEVDFFIPGEPVPEPKLTPFLINDLELFPDLFDVVDSVFVSNGAGLSASDKSRICFFFLTGTRSLEFCLILAPMDEFSVAPATAPLDDTCFALTLLADSLF
jgi:hypothetical protein